MQDKEEISKLNADMFGIHQRGLKDSLKNNTQYDLINNDSLQNFVLRHLTYKYTCPLTVLYGAERAGNSFMYNTRYLVHDIPKQLCFME